MKFRLIRNIGAVFGALSLMASAAASGSICYADDTDVFTDETLTYHKIFGGVEIVDSKTNIQELIIRRRLTDFRF